MKTCTKCLQSKSKVAFSKSSAAKDGLQHHCKECKLQYQRSNSNRNAVSKKYYDENRELCNARSVISQNKRPEHYALAKKRWMDENKDHHLAVRRAWRLANNAKETERKRRRSNRIRNADHLSQAHQAEIQGVYDFCKIFPSFEVDHIVPLNGKTVSGLHVPWNLQALPIKENRSKGNKFMDGYHG